MPQQRAEEAEGQGQQQQQQQDPLTLLRQVNDLVLKQENSAVQLEGDLETMAVSITRIEHILDHIQDYERERSGNLPRREGEGKRPSSSPGNTDTGSTALASSCSKRLSSLSERMATLLETVYTREHTHLLGERTARPVAVTTVDVTAESSAITERQQRDTPPLPNTTTGTAHHQEEQSAVPGTGRSPSHHKEEQHSPVSPNRLMGGVQSEYFVPPSSAGLCTVGCNTHLVLHANESTDTHDLATV